MIRRKINEAVINEGEKRWAKIYREVMRRTCGCTNSFGKKITYDDEQFLFYVKTRESQSKDRFKEYAIFMTLGDDAVGFAEYVFKICMNVLTRDELQDFINMLIECAYDNESHHVAAMLLDYKYEHKLFKERDWSL